MNNNIFMIVSFLVFSYFIGNIMPSLLISKYVMNSDIREHGSGNAGSTNVMRVMGKRYGAIVFILDMLKGVIPTLLALKLFDLRIAYLAGIFTVVGHIFPIFAGFKGGKGVATSFGAALTLNPIYALISILFFAFVVYKARMVSLASMLATALFSLLIIFSKNSVDIKVLSLVFVSLVVFAHRKNIVKIINKTENKI